VSENAALFFGPTDPGVQAAYIAGATDPVYGQLEQEMPDELSNTRVQHMPIFTCAAADVAAVVDGDPAVIDGRTYTVRAVEQDVWEPIAILHLNNPINGA